VKRKMRKPSKTAIFEASRAWDAAAVEALLAMAFWTSHRWVADPKGRTGVAFGMQRKAQQPSVGEASLTRGADPSYSPWAVVWRDDDVVCRELLKNKPRFDLWVDGETPMPLASSG
jgi:hypothetical protein